MDYLIKVSKAKYLGEYKIYCLFSNGEEKIVDLKNELKGEMFKPLRNKNIFMQFRVDDVIKTLVWPNGADIAPYSLYEIGISMNKNIQNPKSSKIKVKK